MKDKRDLTGSILILLSIIGIISLFWRDNILTTGLFIAAASVTFWFWRTREDRFFFLVAFIAGPLMEIFCIYSGAWKYSNPLYLIPPWLPFAWGLSGIVVLHLSRFFLGKGGRKT